jgi:malonate decarboxylase alpha subunit
MRDWQTRRKAKQERMRSAVSLMEGRIVRTERAADLLQALLRPGDRVALEGDNQKQADFLARSLTQLDPANVHDLHLLLSSVSLPEHLDVFENGICKRLDFSFAGEQSVRMAGLVADGTVEVGAIHTYVELYARMFVDLIPDVVLLCATQADREGNLFTGPSTEDTPVIAEAAAFHDGVVVVQVDEIVDTLPRVDIPATGST